MRSRSAAPVSIAQGAPTSPLPQIQGSPRPRQVKAKGSRPAAIRSERRGGPLSGDQGWFKACRVRSSGALDLGPAISLASSWRSAVGWRHGTRRRGRFEAQGREGLAEELCAGCSLGRGRW